MVKFRKKIFQVQNLVLFCVKKIIWYWLKKQRPPSPKIKWLDLTCFHERFVKNLNYKNVKNPLQVSFQFNLMENMPAAILYTTDYTFIIKK
jgi:hypothetical protein